MFLKIKCSLQIALSRGDECSAATVYIIKVELLAVGRIGPCSKRRLPQLFLAGNMLKKY